MENAADNSALAIPPALVAEIQAAADEEHRPAGDVLREMIEQGLGQRRLRAAILARVDKAEASLARGEGIVITEVSMHQLASDVQQRGRARLAAETARVR